LVSDGGGGSGSFVGDLGINEKGLEVGPGFVCCGTVLPFFNVGSEDVGVHDDDDADVDELLVGFGGSLGFCHCCIFMDLVEDGDDRIIMDIDMGGEFMFRGKEGSTGDVAIGCEEVLHGILDGSFDGSGFFVETGHHDGGIESCGDLVLESAFELIGFLEETGCFIEDTVSFCDLGASGIVSWDERSRVGWTDVWGSGRYGVVRVSTDNEAKMAIGSTSKVARDRLSIGFAFAIH